MASIDRVGNELELSYGAGRRVFFDGRGATALKPIEHGQQTIHVDGLLEQGGRASGEGVYRQ